MKKTYLLTPGPTPIPESVSSGFARPIIHHRTPAFQSLFDEVRSGLKYLFQTRQDVLILTSSGTGAMEAAISNLFKRADKVLVVNGGKFGERWAKIAKEFGLNPVLMTPPLGEALDPVELEQTIRSNPDARAVLFQASETSTGVRMPTHEICKIARAASMLSVCDAITACGVFDVPMDDWGIDVLITGSQKALMIPPGLSMIALSERAWTATESSDLPHFYFNLAKERKTQVKNQTGWTPAISLIQGLQESLRLIREEGLHNVFKRHELLARATRNSVHALGLELFARKAPSTAVTAVKVPSEIKDGKMIPKLMRDKYGVTIAGGQDELEGKIFRLSHFGYCDKFDVTTAISGLELVLNELGYKVEFGKGVGAALQTFAEGS
ncbi:MAG: class V aminotransferase [Bdellovibrionales bacterium RIFOXYC1_FULL_54_43]|nr:MAG: class V aminotransferase [Bdellovibrionales bacterium RIFOXYC1_FULL_54_43]